MGRANTDTVEKSISMSMAMLTPPRKDVLAIE